MAHDTQGSTEASKVDSSALVNSHSTDGTAMRLAEAGGIGNISSLADLKRKSPKLYKFMMISIAQNICIQMKRRQDELAEIWRKMREDQGG